MSAEAAGLEQGLRAALPLVEKAIRMLAVDTDFWFDNHWIVESAPVECGRSRPTAKRSGRDELITELVTDAYRSLADAFRAAAGSGSDSGAGLTALAHAMRAWALEDPQRYLLVYGTPVPGYHAPADVTAIASEIMDVLLDACAAQPAPSPAPVTPFEAYLDGHRDWAGGHSAPPAALHRALAFWTRLHGVLSLELAGHFAGMGFDPERLYAAEVEALTGSRT
ncbi:TetR-like C-terminal domain-containing protein [Streptomyces sp. NPDC020490]|uniref:TetR-like C-terminal domain-containing protein n=1 Tax=Streptomyces sp. NPDC020490 TaxID=3365078 RepID=UPI0037B6B39C